MRRISRSFKRMGQSALLATAPTLKWYGIDVRASSQPYLNVAPVTNAQHQMADFDPLGSDHGAFWVSTKVPILYSESTFEKAQKSLNEILYGPYGPKKNREITVAVWNTRMPGAELRGRPGQFNNPFRQVETPEQYTQRMLQQLDKFEQFCKTTPTPPAVVSFLEFAVDITKPVAEQTPVERRKQAAFEEIMAKFKSTFPEYEFVGPSKWGVFTAYRKDLLGADQVLTANYLSEQIQKENAGNRELREIDTRFITIIISTKDEYIYFTTTHMPHSEDPKKTEAAFITCMTAVIDEIISKGSTNKRFAHILAGDWNIVSTRKEAILKNLINERLKIAQDEAAAVGVQLPAFTLDVNITSAPGNHLHRNTKTGELERIAVDGVIECTVKPAEEFGVEISIDPNVIRKERSLAVGALIAGGLFFSPTFTEKEESKTEKKEDQEQQTPQKGF